MKSKKTILLVIALLFTLPFAACANANQATDYAQPEHWLSLPSSVTKNADVFYLYPTVFQKVDKEEPNICNIDNPIMMKYSKLALAFQASAFETTANIYAPYYRQADAAYTLSLPLPEQDKVIGGIPVVDAVAAFDFYIKNYNQGRPFILAGHSQGSNVLLYILSDYMRQNPKVYDRMIAAYVIGYSVTPEYLAKNPHLRFAKGSDDTGVIISYNTEAPKVEGKNPVVLPGALAINPISWTRGEKRAAAEENLGSIEMGAAGQMVFLKDYADARVDKARGAVVCSTTDVEKLSPGNQVFPKGVYHHYDYLFYYFNLKENATNRVQKFLANHNR